MGTLDELRANARAAKSSSDTEDALRKRATERFTQTVTGGMKQTLAGMKELAEHLNLISDPVTSSMYLEGVGDVDGIRRSNYRVVRDPERENDEIRMACTLTLSKPLSIVKHSKATFVHQRRLLNEAGLQFKTNVQNNDPVNPTVEFKIQPQFVGGITLLVQRDALKVDVTFRNLGKFGERTVQLQPHELDDGLLEDFANLLIKRPSRFDVDEKLEISEDVRAKLQAKLQQEGGAKPAKKPTKAKKGLLGGLLKR